MRIFVSYTLRDGLVTAELLAGLHRHLAGIGSPFIHAIEAPRLRCQQLAVLWALLRSRAVVLVVSPSVQQSPWVRLELALGRFLRHPIIPVDVSVLRHQRALLNKDAT
ncbi:toll/interleukin-1 receptor domain-containing protein [Pseudoduganella aquatica]|uniref:toll/interleukin-1 receptor domain-containing protein n=1 Tax=Pseudoduganella aquatica TaxID=2660641 RepID=UPI001E4194EF|nr:toll/interleukin-1 receptor domain-containing protein [Pseudoduganella aquatica]